MTLVGAFAPYYLILLASWGFGALHVLRRPRVWLPILLSAASLTFWVLTAARSRFRDMGAVNQMAIVVWFVGLMVGAWQVFRAVIMIRPIAERVEAMAMVEAPCVVRVKNRDRTYLEELEKLLPLVEPLGHAPGWTTMTPAWINTQLERARADEPAARRLAADVPERDSIKQGLYSRKNGWLVRFTEPTP